MMSLLARPATLGQGYHGPILRSDTAAGKSWRMRLKVAPLPNHLLTLPGHFSSFAGDQFAPCQHEFSISAYRFANAAQLRCSSEAKIQQKAWKQQQHPNQQDACSQQHIPSQQSLP